ncbi:iron-sulfur cluster assembly scaffold protein [Candidatus Parcubacteria bacterium]|nr:MAG: iron-sulfur cluster assembly scaffold protein [Candidatus Parcubacteria bacterium]
MSQTKKSAAADIDIVPKGSDEAWAYSKIIKDHFFKPRNLILDAKDVKGYNGLGMVGSPACGDMMKVWLWIDEKEDKIKEMKWQTFGCGSAISATSMLSVMATENGGMKLDDALEIKAQHITERLGGLPVRKIHCSVLGDKALRSAINNYFIKSGQKDRVIKEQVRIIDKQAKVTDHDIEEAVLEGAQNLEEVQKKTKVGIGNPSVIPEVEQLIRFYTEKYFG